MQRTDNPLGAAVGGAVRDVRNAASDVKNAASSALSAAANAATGTGYRDETRHYDRPMEFIAWHEEVEIKPTETVIGKVRLHTQVTEERVSKQIPLEHEECRIVRERISPEEAARLTPRDIGELHQEVELRAQEAVVSKRMVPTERIRVELQRVKDMVTVDEVVRSETFRIEEPPKVELGQRVHRVADQLRTGFDRR